MRRRWRHLGCSQGWCASGGTAAGRRARSGKGMGDDGCVVCVSSHNTNQTARHATSKLECSQDAHQLHAPYLQRPASCKRCLVGRDGPRRLGDGCQARVVGGCQWREARLDRKVGNAHARSQAAALRQAGIRASGASSVHSRSPCLPVFGLTPSPADTSTWPRASSASHHAPRCACDASSVL